MRKWAQGGAVRKSEKTLAAANNKERNVFLKYNYMTPLKTTKKEVKEVKNDNQNDSTRVFSLGTVIDQSSNGMGATYSHEWQSFSIGKPNSENSNESWETCDYS